MTAIRVARRRLSISLSAARAKVVTLTLFLLVAMVAAGGLLVAWGDRGGSAAVTVMIPRAEQAALVAATSGEQAALVSATGERAQVINAALPFSATPVQAALPFSVAGETLDQRRALLCLTQAVYYEAGFEPIDGRRAVAQVVLNRMRHPAFPKSVCGVVYQRNSTPVCQFSFVCDGSLNRAPAAAAWRTAQDIARAALAGHVEGTVGQATHYHADYVAPRWAPMLAKITKLGAHIFYRWPGAWGRTGAFTGRYIGEPNDPSALRPVLRAVLDGVTDPSAAIGLVESGPPIARAPNDVGGLLDVSKGWTLKIPVPLDVAGAASRTIATQQAAPKTGATVVASAAASPAIAAN